jgi:rhodanese-related sulfurtransferase
MTNATGSTASPATDPVTPAGSGQNVTPGQLRAWLAAGQAVLIDVREPDEYAREHIEGARLLPLSRFDPGRAAALAAPGQHLVMQCRSGKRAADACRMALSAAAPGQAVLTLAGGLDAWKRENLPVVTDRRVAKISVLRQTQMVIGAGVLAGCVLGWLVHPGFVGLAAFFGAGLVFAGASGTCALASVVAAMPWNKASASAGACAAPER